MGKIDLDLSHEQTEDRKPHYIANKRKHVVNFFKKTFFTTSVSATIYCR